MVPQQRRSLHNRDSFYVVWDFDLILHGVLRGVLHDVVSRSVIEMNTLSWVWKFHYVNLKSANKPIIYGVPWLILN